VMATLSFARPRLPRARALWLALLGRTATMAGTVVRESRARRRAVPGLAGAAMVAYGVALVYLPAGVVAGGLFLLWFGSEINRAPTPPALDTSSSY
jgi:threonine/homoserine/homoserine lactone efflux protein